MRLPWPFLLTWQGSEMPAGIPGLREPRLVQAAPVCGRPSWPGCARLGTPRPEGWLLTHPSRCLRKHGGDVPVPSSCPRTPAAHGAASSEPRNALPGGEDGAAGDVAVRGDVAVLLFYVLKKTSAVEPGGRQGFPGSHGQVSTGAPCPGGMRCLPHGPGCVQSREWWGICGSPPNAA